MIEPAARGTAPAIALSAITLRRRDPEAIMAVLTADHFIGDEEGFREVLKAACEVAARDQLVTLGVTPSSPSTGYGYIERGQHLMQANGYLAYRVIAFREKPDLVTAKHFVTSGRHSWNSGMFVWKVSRFLDELSRTMPEFYQQLLTIDAALGTSDYDRVLREVTPHGISQSRMVLVGGRTYTGRVILAGTPGIKVDVELIEGMRVAEVTASVLYDPKGEKLKA